jgi:tRNA(Ile)-lysidine synthase
MAVSRKALKNNAIADTVAAAIASHLPRDASLVLGLSGGLDSVVLFHLIRAYQPTLGFRFGCVHVHHGLSDHADHWAEFCRTLCAEHDVPFDLQRVSVAHDDPAGIEAAARSARHRVFAAIEADALLTAHHQDDQAETLLLQLLRGAGPKGLAAMAAWHHPPGWKAVQLRPLLEVTRADIRAYAERHQLRWVEDESNLDPRYRRNALRHKMLPQLGRDFPGYSATLARAAALQAEAAELLDDLAVIDAAGKVCDDRLDCVALARLTPARQRNLLRHFIAAQGYRLPSERRLDQGLRQLLNAGRDAQVCVNLGEVDLHRFRGQACLAAHADTLESGAVEWRGEAQLDLPWLAQPLSFSAATGAGVKREWLEAGPVEVRRRQGGERLRLVAGGPHRSLKNLLQEAAIPPWRRASLPLLWCRGQLAWAAEVGYDADCLARPGEAGIILSLGGQENKSSKTDLFR